LTIGFSLALEQALQTCLVLGGEQGNRGARVGIVWKVLQRGRERRDEGLVSATQHEPQQRARLELGVGDAGVLERPARQVFYEFRAKISKRRALGAG
jgi:hypothetical protein